MVRDRMGKSLRISAGSIPFRLTIARLILRSASTVTLSLVGVGLDPQLGPEPLVSLLLELLGQLGPARLDDPSTDQHMDVVGLHVVQDPLVVGDEQQPQVGAAEL